MEMPSANRAIIVLAASQDVLVKRLFQEILMIIMDKGIIAKAAKGSYSQYTMTKELNSPGDASGSYLAYFRFG
jgi:hypothetical protein